MRIICLMVLLFLGMIFIAGCTGGETAAALGGLGAGIEIAKISNERLLDTIQEADTIQVNLQKVVDSAEGALKNDPNAIAALLAAISQDDANNIIAQALETYSQSKGTVETIKEKAKDPAWWAAFVLALTAAYQKYQRAKKK